MERFLNGEDPYPNFIGWDNLYEEKWVRQDREFYHP